MWFQRYGFKVNPFSIKPTSNIVGFEKERSELLNYVLSDEIILIKGEMGTGKTSMLYWLYNEMKKMNKKIIFIPTYYKNKNEIRTYLRKKLNIIERYIFKKEIPEGYIILIDEAQDLSRNTVEYLRILWDENKIRSLVFAGTDLDMSDFTKDRIKIIEMRPMNFEEIYMLLKSRIGDKNLFTIDAIKKLAEIANYIPRKFLRLCEKALMEAKDVPITDKDIDTLLSKKTKEPELKKLKEGGTVQDKIIALLKGKGPLTAKEISETLGITIQSTWKHISILYKKGLIEKIRGKPVKYKLKEK